MSTAREAKNKAKSVNSAYVKIEKSGSNLKAAMSDVNSWWKGNAATTTIKEYNSIQTEFNSFMKSIKSLEDVTNKLANKIQQADDEKKAAAKTTY